MPKQKSPNPSEHIFPATQLTALALRWKELSGEGRHKEAMLVLEQVIEGTTAMLERLAQYEDYHYTVDLPILVSAAQEKVVKWLMYWNPSKGRLFSFFSKSFAGDTYVITADGSAVKIKDIVDKRMAVDVLSWNRSTGAFEPKPVIAWHKTPVNDLSVWRQLKFKAQGNKKWKSATLTRDHEVFTDRGIARVDELDLKHDHLCLSKPLITPDGMSALIGMYLGDGSISKAGHFVVTHGTGQEGYTRHIAEKFGNRKVWSSTVTLKSNGKAYPVWRTRLLHRRVWENCPLSRVKTITEWLLDNINPVVLAYWYMDDGSISQPKNNPNDRYIPKFCCEKFSYSDQLRIAERLLFEWHIETSPQKYKGKYRLTVLDGSVDRFFKLIQPYILPCLEYKLPPDFRGRHKTELELIRYERVFTGDFKVAKVKGGTRIREKLKFKYDITVADHHNVVVLNNSVRENGTAYGLCAAQCAKNAFRSELVKVNQFRKRFHVTSDNLEMFYGAEDHEVDKHDLTRDVRHQIEALTCRWGDPQEIGAIHYLIECIIDGNDNTHDKHAAIRSAAYAYGISFDLSKFFYAWSISALRRAMYDRIYVPFTEQDLLRAAESYDHLVDLLDVITWEQLKQIIAIWGGKRLNIPTLAKMAKMKENYALYQAVDKSDLDPDSVAAVAKKFKKTPRTAQEIFNEMTEIIDPRRYGEYSIYDNDDSHS